MNSQPYRPYSEARIHVEKDGQRPRFRATISRLTSQEGRAYLSLSVGPHEVSIFAEELVAIAMAEELTAAVVAARNKYIDEHAPQEQLEGEKQPQ